MIVRNSTSKTIRYLSRHNNKHIEKISALRKNMRIQSHGHRVASINLNLKTLFQEQQQNNHM